MFSSLPLTSFLLVSCFLSLSSFAIPINGIPISKLEHGMIQHIEDTETKLKNDKYVSRSTHVFRLRMFVSLVYGQKHELTKRVMSSTAYPGARVKLQHLSKSELNGKIGRVIQWNEKRQRWKICLESDENMKIAVRSCNITVLFIS